MANASELGRSPRQPEKKHRMKRIGVPLIGATIALAGTAGVAYEVPQTIAAVRAYNSVSGTHTEAPDIDYDNTVIARDNVIINAAGDLGSVSAIGWGGVLIYLGR